MIFRASVAELWRIITTIHTRDPEKDLNMKDQAETATGKREGDLKDNRPGNSQDRHHYLHLPHLVPREAERTPASQAGVLDIHNDRLLLEAGRDQQDVWSGSNSGDYSSRIDSWQMLITASFSMVKLWDSILKNSENLEQVINLVQQSLGNRFCLPMQFLNTHCRKQFQGCLTKEFRSLADNEPNKSETTLSPWLFGSNLEEQIKSKVDSSTISRKVISREIPRFRTNPFQNQNQNFPNSPSRRRGRRRQFLPQNQYQRRRQQKRGKPAHTQTQSRPGNDNRSKYFVPKDPSIFRSLGTDNKMTQRF